MSIFNIDFNQKAAELLPPDKRQSAFLAWVKSLFTPMIYNRTRIFNDYKLGVFGLYPVWAAGTYDKGDRVIYLPDGRVYEALYDGVTSAPTDTTLWLLYQMDFIGVDERLMYNGEKVVLEYALNKRFNTTFRQPNDVSDIYIGTNPSGIFPFIVGGVEDISSSVFLDYSEQFIIDDYTFGEVVNFAIYVPIATWTDLSTDVDARDKIIRGFVDLYNIVGTTYNIITY